MLNNFKNKASQFIKENGSKLIKDVLNDPKKVNAIKGAINKGLDNTKVTSSVGLSKDHTNTIKKLINKI